MMPGSSHGTRVIKVASALLMASTHAYIHVLASMDQPLARVFDMANENLHHETDAGQFITAFFGRIDPATRVLTYVSAGHPHGYVLDPRGEVRETLESTGLPLAVIPGVNDDEANLRATAEFAAALPRRHAVSILPYHAAAADKYKRLNQSYTLGETLPPGDDRIACIAGTLEGFGLEVRTGG